MTSIVSFIGWHDSGKTTLATRVVAELRTLGYRVGVIKSSSDAGIEFDTPGTDTYKHREAGAESVMIVAPDQMVLQTGNRRMPLRTLVHRYFPDVDIVIGEGFKDARQIPKIEVFQHLDQRLREQVTGVIAVATDMPGVKADLVFHLDEAREIALYIEKRFIKPRRDGEVASLLVNGHRVPLKRFVQEALAGTVLGFIKTLKLGEEIGELDLRIKINE